MDKSQVRLVEQGHCDERGAGFAANVVRLADNFGPGIVMLCVKGNKLNIHDIDMPNTVLDVMYSVELNKIQNLKWRHSIFFGVLKFTYEGKKYRFNNFFGCKDALKVIEEESKK